MPRLVAPVGNLVSMSPNINDLIEDAARKCYLSESKTTHGDGFERFEEQEKFLKDKIRLGHHSILEHGYITVDFVFDRGVSHEMVRHRLAAFSQESTRYCVAGGTDLTMKNPHQKYTVAEMYQNKINSPNGAWKRMHIRQLDEETGELIYSKIQDIFLVGVKPTVTIHTKLGYSLTLTPDHGVRTELGYIEAQHTLGKLIAINGTDLAYKNRDWLFHQYNTLMKTAVQIAYEHGWADVVVKKWVRKHNLPKKPKSYWNLGKEAWNKGRTKETDSRVLQIAESRKAYTEGLTCRTYMRAVGVSCEVCGSMHNLNVHHIDEDRENNDPSNFLKVAYFDEVVSITQGPIVEVYDLVMEAPNHNFVANGIVVHNCNYSKSKFGTEIAVIPPFFFPQDEVAPEQSEFELFKGLNRFDVWLSAMAAAEMHYLQLIAMGVTAQEARSVLPNSLKTEIRVSANVREWRHIAKIRTEKGAHPQMAQIMVPLLHEFKEEMPVLFHDIDPDPKWAFFETPCPGIHIGDGQFSGCVPGNGDCPACGKHIE